MKKLRPLGISLLITSLSVFIFTGTLSANDLNIVSIKNIAHWDYLNIRASASASSEILGKIPSKGEGIVLLGNEQKTGQTQWINIKWGAVEGWVNANYLNFFSTDTMEWEKYVDKPKKTESVKTKEALQSIRTQKEQYGTAAEFRTKISEYREKIAAEKALLAAQERLKQTEKKQSQSATTNSKSKVKTTHEIVLKCGGVKPFWNIDLTEDDIQININQKRNELPITSRRKSSFYEKSVVIQGYGAQQENGVKLYLSKDNVCKDGITNIRYPYSVKAILNGNKVYYGCCDAVQ